MLPGSARTGDARISAKAATLNTASSGRPVTRLTRASITPGWSRSAEGAPPIRNALTRWPRRRTTPGVTSTAATMLRIVTTPAPIAADSRIVPGEKTITTSIIDSRTKPANAAVRPAVFAASDAA